MASAKKKDWTDESAAAFVFWAQLCAAAHPKIHRKEQEIASTAATVIAKIPMKYLVAGYEMVDNEKLDTETALRYFREMPPKLQLDTWSSLIAISLADNEIQDEEVQLLGILMQEIEAKDEKDLIASARTGLEFGSPGTLK
ncbi:MAG: hypothetical protein ACPGGL_08420 [Phycisphaerales bacterium]